MNRILRNISRRHAVMIAVVWPAFLSVVVAVILYRALWGSAERLPADSLITVDVIVPAGFWWKTLVIIFAPPVGFLFLWARARRP